MRTAIQTIFFIQIVLERAVERLTEISNSITGQYIGTPLKHSVREFIGIGEQQDSSELRTEVDSIRAELQGLRNDVRELQKTPV